MREGKKRKRKKKRGFPTYQEQPEGGRTRNAFYTSERQAEDKKAKKAGGDIFVSNGPNAMRYADRCGKRKPLIDLFDFLFPLFPSLLFSQMLRSFFSRVGARAPLGLVRPAPAAVSAAIPTRRFSAFMERDIDALSGFTEEQKQARFLFTSLSLSVSSSFLTFFSFVPIAASSCSQLCSRRAGAPRRQDRQGQRVSHGNGGLVERATGAFLDFPIGASAYVLLLSKPTKQKQDLWGKLGDAGFLGPTAPTEFGGLGLGYLEHIILIEELSRVSGSVGLSYVAVAR